MKSFFRALPIRIIALTALFFYADKKCFAAFVPGNFEARLQLPAVGTDLAEQTDDLYRTALLKVQITSTKSFSGQVVIDGLAQAIKGILLPAAPSDLEEAGVETGPQFWAVIPRLPGMTDNIYLRYYPAFPVMFEQTEAFPPEEVLYAGWETFDPTSTLGVGFWNAALRTPKPETDRSVNRSLAMAFKCSLPSEPDPELGDGSALDARLLEIANAVAARKQELEEATPSLVSATAEAASAKAQVGARTKELLAAKAKFAAYYKAFDSAKAKAALSEAAMVAAGKASSLGIANVLVSDKKLAQGETVFDYQALARDISDNLLSRVSQNSDFSSLTFDKDFTGEIGLLALRIKDLVAGTKIGYRTTVVDDSLGLSEWHMALTELESELSFSQNISGLFPETFTVADSKALFSKIAPHLLSLLEASRLSVLANAALSRQSPELYQEFNPAFDPSPAQIAEEALASANQAMAEAQMVLTGIAYTTGNLKALISNLDTIRSATIQKYGLINFKGYGTASITVTGSPAGITAAFTGLSPSGQKWTYSGQLRCFGSGYNEDGSGESVPTDGNSGFVSLSALAGKNPISGDLAMPVYNGASDVALLTGVEIPALGLRVDTRINWNGAQAGWGLSGTAEGIDSSELLSSYAPVALKDQNLFGGPLLPGTNTLDKTKFTNVVLDVGTPAEFQPGLTGGNESFGAQISVNNFVTKLLVARKGTEFKLLTAPASFSGKYPATMFTYEGTPPRALVTGVQNGSAAFSGILLKTEEGVVGYGAVQKSTIASTPVLLKVSDAVPGGVQPPSLPEIKSSVVWKGVPSSILGLTLEPPSEASLTTVTLLKGGSVITSAEADPTGWVRLNAPVAVTGSDYTLKVVRETLSGVSAPVFSNLFTITQKTLQADSFQCLLKAGASQSGEESEDLGLSSREVHGRLAVTTTAAGAWSGKLELVEYTSALNEFGQAESGPPSRAEGFWPGWDQEGGYIGVPKLFTYALKGSLEGFSELASESAQEPSLRILVPVQFGDKSRIYRCLNFDVAFFLNGTRLNANVYASGDGGATLAGEGSPATKGIAVAKGKYYSADGGPNWEKLRDQYTWDYAGGSTVIYGWKSGTTTLAGSANVGLDGEIPIMFAPAAILTGKLPYTYQDSSGAEKTATSTLVTTAVGFMTARLDWSIPPESSVATPLIEGVTSLYFTGATLEADPKVKGGFRYNSAWGDTSNLPGPLYPGRFEAASAMFSTLRAGHPSVTSVKEGVQYGLSILHANGTLGDHTVQFTKTGLLLLSNLDNPAKAVLKAFMGVATTGLFSGSFQIPGVVKPLAVTGSYVDDPVGGILARGTSSDGMLVWSLRQL